MKKIFRFFLTSLILFVAAVPLLATERQTTTQEDQTSLEITVYNSNLGLVKDQRQVKLAAGVQE